MKRKIAIGMVRTFAIGAGLYALVKFFRYINNTVNRVSKNCIRKNSMACKDYSPETTENNDWVHSPGIEDIEKSIVTIKNGVAENISTRHREAEKIIRESVLNIFDDTDKAQNRETKNDSKINAMLNDLKNM